MCLPPVTVRASTCVGPPAPVATAPTATIATPLPVAGGGSSSASAGALAGAANLGAVALPPASTAPLQGTDEQKQAEFLERVIQGVSRLQDPRVAKAEGYTRFTHQPDGVTVHIMSERAMNDGRTMDPNNPEVIIVRFDPDQRQFRVIGAMFQANTGETLDAGIASMKFHDHGHGDTSTHVWLTPGDLATAFSDRQDPPDVLMGEFRYAGGSRLDYRNDPASGEVLRAAWMNA